MKSGMSTWMENITCCFLPGKCSFKLFFTNLCWSSFQTTLSSPSLYQTLNGRKHPLWFKCDGFSYSASPVNLPYDGTWRTHLISCLCINVRSKKRPPFPSRKQMLHIINTHKAAGGLSEFSIAMGSWGWSAWNHRRTVYYRITYGTQTELL